MKNPDAWVQEVIKRFGWTEEAVRKAFADELAGGKRSTDPLQVPDRMAMDFRFSYGGVSPFFRALRDEARILGSRCPRCGKVWLPPRTTCQACYTATEWKEVGPGGEVVAATTVHYATSTFFAKTPFVCAYVRLDGASTAIMGNVLADDVAAVKPGTRVKAKFREVRLGTMGDFCFEREWVARIVDT